MCGAVRTEASLEETRARADIEEEEADPGAAALQGCAVRDRERDRPLQPHEARRRDIFKEQRPSVWGGARQQRGSEE